MESEVSYLMQQVKISLENPKAEVCQSLSNICHLLPGQTINQTQQQTEFLTTQYSHFLEMLLDHLSVDFLERIPKKLHRSLFDVFFLEGVHHEAFLVLNSCIQSNSTGFKLHKCVSLLEAMLQQHRLADIFWTQSTRYKNTLSNANEKEVYCNVISSDLVTFIASLPERVTNRLGKETSDIFFPKQYISLICDDIMTTLKKIYIAVKTEKDSSTKFLSLLLGKLSASGHADLLWARLLPEMLVKVSKDFIWSRICENIVVGIPDRYIENAVLPIIKQAPSYSVVSKLLADSVLTNRKLCYILTNKLLLMRYFDSSKVLQNIIGYLACSQSRRHIYIKVFHTLLDVWGDKGSIKHTSYEQHKYITKAILIFTGLLNDNEKEKYKEEFTMKLMAGVQHHIESPVSGIRVLGMLLAESLTRTIDPKGQPLSFEYTNNEETAELLELLIPPAKEPQNLEDIEKSVKDIKISESDIPEEPVSLHKVSNDQTEVELDSDDDLEPFDLSNDEKITKAKKPVYVRDCMQGMIGGDDPDVVEVCLSAAEECIRRHPDNLDEIAVEFSKVLLHLQDQYRTTDFSVQRHRAMVALLVLCPMKTADYLANEFFEVNYSVKQRLDILEVLASAAQELSSVHREDGSPNKVDVRDSSRPSTADDWRSIVQKRIDNKTRRFASRPKLPHKGSENKFASVAGCFFFPLLRKADRQERYMDLLGDDCILLGRLLYTVGVIMYCAVNAPVARQMGTCLLEFVWTIRYHREPFVRRAVIFCLSMVFLSLPGFMLFTDLQGEVLEAKTWLEDTVNNDSDTESKELSLQALLLLENIYKKEFHGSQKLTT